MHDGSKMKTPKGCGELLQSFGYKIEEEYQVLKLRLEI
jgi:hypothetical protein